MTCRERTIVGVLILTLLVATNAFALNLRCPQNTNGGNENNDFPKAGYKGATDHEGSVIVVSRKDPNSGFGCRKNDEGDWVIVALIKNKRNEWEPVEK